MFPMQFRIRSQSRQLAEQGVLNRVDHARAVKYNVLGRAFFRQFLYQFSIPYFHHHKALSRSRDRSPPAARFKKAR